MYESVNEMVEELEKGAPVSIGRMLHGNWKWTWMASETAVVETLFNGYILKKHLLPKNL